MVYTALFIGGPWHLHQVPVEQESRRYYEVPMLRPTIHVPKLETARYVQFRLPNPAIPGDYIVLYIFESIT